MMNVVSLEDAPKWPSFEWNDGQIDAVHYEPGTLQVNHWLPPKVETAVILSAAGLGTTAVSEMIKYDDIDKLTDIAYQEFGVPVTARMHKDTRTPALIGRLFLPGSLLENIEPVPLKPWPDETCQQILTSLGEGNRLIHAEVLRGGNQLYARHYIAQHYYPETFGGEFNVNALLFHAYGAGFIDPQVTVAKQPGVLPEWLRDTPAPETSGHAAEVITLRQLAPSAPDTSGTAHGETQEHTRDFPERFQPFSEDPDSIVHLKKNEANEYVISHIETAEAMLEVLDVNTITNWGNQQITLSSEEKLALTLIAMGATPEELAQYCMEDEQQVHFRKKLGVRPEEYGLTQATLLACRELLSPINPTVWNPTHIPDFSWLEEYTALNEIRQGKLASVKTMRANASIVSKMYTRQEKPAVNDLNLMILLAYADDRVPQNVLKNDHAGFQPKPVKAYKKRQ